MLTPLLSNKLHPSLANQNLLAINTKKQEFHLNFGRLTQERYTLCNECFTRNTTEKKETAEVLDFIFKSMKNLGWLDKHSGSLKVLDIGCGNGKQTLLILQKLLQYFKKSSIHLTAVDINPSLLESLTALMKKHKFTTHAIEANCFTISLPKANTDFILASHVFYRSRDITNDIRNMLTLLKPKGFACIALGRSDTDDIILRNAYHQTAGLQTEDCNKIQPVTAVMKALTSDLLNLKNRYFILPVTSNLKFPRIPKGGFSVFQKWQMNNPHKEPPNKECQTTLDLLEFIIDEPLKNLRDKGHLETFLTHVQSLLLKNGTDQEGNPRLIMRSNLFIIPGLAYATATIEKMGKLTSTSS